MNKLILLDLGTVLIRATIGGAVYHDKKINKPIVPDNNNTVEHGINYND